MNNELDDPGFQDFGNHGTCNPRRLYRFLIAVLFFTSTITLHGQTKQRLTTIDDTISAGEVIVIPELPDGANGYKSISLDKDIIDAFDGKSLSTILSYGTSNYIKSYGAGGLSTSSFRGMGANHTQIVWEGLRVDNPMTGQTDLSTFSSAFIDNITLFSGGSPAGFGNRGPGGTILIQSDPDWSDGTDIKYIQNIGSFSDFSESIRFRTGNSNVQYSLRANTRKAKNDYSYYDILNGNGDDILQRTGSSYSSRGILHELNVKSINTLYSARLWYTYSDRNIPSSIAFPATDGNEHQTDESLRTMLSFVTYRPNGKITGKIAYVSDWLDYDNIMFAIESRNLVNSLNSSLQGNYQISESSSVSLGIDGRYTRVKTNNYENPIERKEFSFDAVWSKLFLDRIGVYLSLNEEFVDNEFLSVSPSIGFDISLIESHDYHIKGSIGRSNHLPTLNDLYWLPGGNPDLETETAENIELGFSLNEKLFSLIQISTSITAYNSSISNMIVWQPDTGFVWTPQNVLKVRSRGMEIEQSVAYNTHNQVYKLLASYHFTEVSQQNNIGASDNLVDKQLVYVPRNMASIAFLYSYENFKFSWRSSYTGVRFTSSDNSSNLPAYWLHDLSVQSQFSVNSVGFEAGLYCNNILGTDYQNVENYPMPWRSFTLSLSIQFGNR